MKPKRGLLDLTAEKAKAEARIQSCHDSVGRIPQVVIHRALEVHRATLAQINYEISGKWTQ